MVFDHLWEEEEESELMDPGGRTPGMSDKKNEF